MSSQIKENEPYIVERVYLGKYTAREAIGRIIRAKIETEYSMAKKSEKGGVPDNNEKTEAC